MNEPRPRGSGFRREHPVFFWGMAALIALFAAATLVVGARIPRYQREATRIDRQMSAEERATRDSVLQSRAKRSELAVALLRRELRVKTLEQKGMHLAISLDDSVLELRHGKATLRRAPLRIGPDSIIRAPDGRTWRFVRALGERQLAEKQVSPVYTVPEWVYLGQGQPVPPEAERRVAGGLGRYVLRLDDGTEIYTEPQEGPLKGVVKPASFVARARDLAAIFDAVREDTPVFIY
ncbi:MAG TPA: hypothetical protein VFX98_02275 [Longimicrobiaceae bacterium]|nr:hypothetical protein [Longimicrobiaceae bacterium]